jgi:hypothetical protein
VVPLINILCKLIYLLTFANLSIGISLLIIDVLYITYPTTPEAHASITLGVWDLLTGFIVISFGVMIVICTLILNVGALTQMFSRRGWTERSSSPSSSTGGSVIKSSEPSHHMTAMSEVSAV